MGTVYLARDVALARPAAIKVVSDEYDRTFRQRLLREAEANARLQHPAIATFYESGESDGIAFIAMEYVRGQTLRERLGAGALPLKSVLGAGSALLEGLDHAHAAGILHRDIKPENIMLTEAGAPKLLDFGLARGLAADTAGETVTNLSAARVLGTPGYMSPEQLRGEELDARSDVFALGAVLYEMIDGRAAFPGRSPSERIAAILDRDPTPLAGASIPARLNDVIMRALAKDRQERYGSASAVLADLRALLTGEALATLPQTLAVLDLRNLSGRSEDDWIGSGIAESLTVDLARIPGLTVVSRDKVLQTLRESSSRSAPPRDALEVGSLLGCRWILSGSFQRSGSAVRITASLAEVGTGQVVSAEKLDGSLDDIFAMQDRLSQGVAANLHLRLPAPIGVGGERDVQAFEYYARGRRLWQRLEKGTLDQAGELYKKAIAVEPTHAPALAGLASLHAMRFTFTTDPQELDHAADYARRAIVADPALGEPRIWLGYVLMRQEKLEEALVENLRAFEFDPKNPYTAYFVGCIEFFRQRAPEAVPFFQHAVKCDPPLGFAWLALANAHITLGNLAEAIWCLERTIALERGVGVGPTVGAAAYLGECCRLQGHLDDARAACITGLEAVERSDHMYRDTFRGVALCTLGRIAVDRGDAPAASAALHQLVAHISGRERTLGGGYLVVQALAGLAVADNNPDRLKEARRLFDSRDRFNFSLLWGCTADAALMELARAALALGDPDGTALLARARDAGSYEARRRLETRAAVSSEGH
jgi:serine/threonine protein kinase/tetratricopeptide (TPR) repeat protein